MTRFAQGWAVPGRSPPSSARPQGHPHLDPAVQAVEDLDEAVDREAVEGRFADAGDVGLGRAGERGGARAAQVAFSQDADDRGGEIGLHQLGVGIGQACVGERIVAPAHDLQLVLTHRNCSLTRLMRSRIRSISCFGVLIPVLAFFWKACSTQTSSSICTA